MNDNQKEDLRERCYYLLTLFKARNMGLFEKYTAQLANVSAEDSGEFYRFLLGEFKKLVEGTPVQAPPKTVQPKTPVKEEAKPAPLKKPAKKAAKKAVKKVTKKKVSKKAPVKKKAAPKKKKSTVKKTAKKMKKKK